MSGTRIRYYDLGDGTFLVLFPDGSAWWAKRRPTHPQGGIALGVGYRHEIAPEHFRRPCKPPEAVRRWAEGRNHGES